ncbi:MAG TPA: polyhydroxyalkanoate synthesis regulator DNA-binding domain-containing protein [Thermoanaerobaculia bacterium]|jgi:polyhydroxyalkanoate synthesis repressor PhaR
MRAIYDFENDTTFSAEELGLDGRRTGMIRVIKRYESRKLYDTEESRYVSLDDVAAWVREGQEIQVIDNATSDDVTAQILTQVIHEEGKRGTSFLPTELLHELVRGGERLVASGVDKVQDRVEGLVRRSIDRLAPVRQAREEMVHLRERLAELERTLQSLEAESKADTARSGKPRAARSAKKPAAKKAARQ